MKKSNNRFTFKECIIGSASNDRNHKNAEINVPLKYLCNFWRSLKML